MAEINAQRLLFLVGDLNHLSIRHNYVQRSGIRTHGTRLGYEGFL